VWGEKHKKLSRNPHTPPRLALEEKRPKTSSFSMALIVPKENLQEGKKGGEGREGGPGEGPVAASHRIRKVLRMRKKTALKGLGRSVSYMGTAEKNWYQRTGRMQ